MPTTANSAAASNQAQSSALCLQPSAWHFVGQSTRNRLLGRARLHSGARRYCLALGISFAQVACAPVSLGSAPVPAAQAAQLASRQDSAAMDNDRVEEFLRRLKHIIEAGLMDQPAQIEEVFQFRVTGWRDAASDDAFSRERARTEAGSFGGLSAAWHLVPRNANARLPVLSFAPVSRGAIRPRISQHQISNVFGPGFRRLPPTDFHRISGGSIVYEFEKPRPVRLTFDASSGRGEFVVTTIYVRQLAD